MKRMIMIIEKRKFAQLHAIQINSAHHENIEQRTQSFSRKIHHSRNYFCRASNRSSILRKFEYTTEQSIVKASICKVSRRNDPRRHALQLLTIKENGIQETGIQAADDTIYSGRLGSINAQYALREADKWTLECGTFSQACSIVICISSKSPKCQ